MKKYILFVLLLLSPLAASAQWTPVQVFTAGSDQRESVSSAVVDSQDNLYIASQFATDLVLAPGFELKHKGGTDIFLARLSPSFEVDWTIVIGGNTDELCNNALGFSDIPGKLLLDSENNVYLTGTFSKDADFDQDGISDISTEGLCNYFIAKYSPEGDFKWVISSGRELYDRITGAVINANDELIVTGEFVDAVIGQRVFINRYNTEGELVQNTYFGNYNEQDDDPTLSKSVSLFESGSGSVYVSIMHTFDLQLNDPEETLIPCTPRPFPSCRVTLKLNKQGKVENFFTDLTTLRMTEGHDRSLYFTSFPASPNTILKSQSSRLTFTGFSIARHNSKGEFLWARDGDSSTPIPPNNSYGIYHTSNLLINSQSLLMTGRGYGNLDLNNDGIIDLSTPNIKGFVAQFSLKGELQNAFHLNFAKTEYTNDVSISKLLLTNDNHLIATGWFAENIQLDPELKMDELVSRGFSDLIIVKYQIAPTIPVELTEFTATADGHDVHLNWHTASEINNAGFEVVHNGEAATFVKGAGTTNEPQTYTHTLSNLAAGTHTFQLKQIDFDGAFDYSEIITLTFQLNDTYRLTKAYPNPFNPQTTFELSVVQDQNVDIALYDMLGRRVQTIFAGHLLANSNRIFTIDGTNLSSGMYLYRVQGEQFVTSERVSLLK